MVTEDYLTQLNLHDNSSLLSTITAIYDIGCFFGAIAAVMIGDPLGRKNSILVGTTIMSVGAILQITAFGVPQMIVGRYVITQLVCYTLITNDEFQYRCRYWQRYQHFHCTCLARRNFQGIMAWKADYHRK